ncbi:hypothetical protein MPTK1_7g00240 [Marchantia polymorpha subsp. ruderalis]|uniref:Uncharacterized protein n=2 Tax=Marchantia polymorpha TaxID=3197 RepID=A0AAF6BUN5_MARPO|nr:hypothetical protein MARPO_0256s0001 [Marchantia polymorpha]BBN15719.1 hypothetical protein Mp_7g00240 [Marchantia polymorpha subsp. ruderalis]|eukprot:PTQ26953.1 hypothetical protein MARPO_0256s0001 [Marchantia polymorpha]
MENAPNWGHSCVILIFGSRIRRNFRTEETNCCRFAKCLPSSSHD